MSINNGSEFVIKKLMYHYHYIEKDYDILKKYYLQSMKIDNGDILNGFINYCKEGKNDRKISDVYNNSYNYSWINELKRYYDSNDVDYTFIDCYKYFPNDFVDILNKKFSNDIDLPDKFVESLDIINNNNINQIVKQKQYILKMTNIFPKNYRDKYLIHFMELLSISRKANIYFSRDIIMKIAGNLFI